MSKKLNKQIEIFTKLASLVSSLCRKYNNNYIKPFLNGAQVYSENYRSGTEFQHLIRLHDNFMQGSISICNSLFENYEELKQKSIYEWSHHFFNLLNEAKKVLDESYILAYTVGRTDITTTSLIENETNPLVKIQRKVIIEDGDFDIYKKNIFNWKCSIQALYVEEEFMKHIVEVCNGRGSRISPQDVKVTTCRFKRSAIMPDSNFSSTPQICVLNAELINQKSKIEIQEKNSKLTVDDINNYIVAYSRYQRELVAFVFTNFIKLYNESCVQCIKVFLEQQHSIMFNLIQKRKSLIVAERVKITENKNMDNIAWSNIDKVSNACSKGTCSENFKVVGSID